MAIKERMSGNEAVSYAIRQVNPDVMPAFPITPSTEIPQMVSTYIANGEMDTEFIPVESEHSSMSAAIGSEAAGARSLTATSSVPTEAACGSSFFTGRAMINNRTPNNTKINRLSRRNHFGGPEPPAPLPVPMLPVIFSQNSPIASHLFFFPGSGFSTVIFLNSPADFSIIPAGLVQCPHGSPPFLHFPYLFPSDPILPHCFLL